LFIIHCSLFMFMLHENGPGHGHEHGTGMDMDIGMDRNVVIPLLAKDSFSKIWMLNIGH
jgi:hypothetical protein